jgi:hypothetical protein
VRPIGDRQQPARQEEDQHDDDEAENGAVIIEEIRPEHLFEQRESRGADHRSQHGAGSAEQAHHRHLDGHDDGE